MVLRSSAHEQKEGNKMEKDTILFKLQNSINDIMADMQDKLDIEDGDVCWDLAVMLDAQTDNLAWLLSKILEAQYESKLEAEEKEEEE